MPLPRAADKASWPAVGELTVGDDGLAEHQRFDIAIGPLNEPSRAAGQIPHLLGVVQTQVVQVDEIDVGAPARLQYTAITEAVEVGRIAGEPMHGRLQRDPRAARAVTHP